MNEVDQQLMSRYGVDRYLQIAVVSQHAFSWYKNGKCYYWQKAVVPGVTVVEGFEDSGVITNDEVRFLLTRNLRFLQSARGWSSIHSLAYMPIRLKDQVGDVKSFEFEGKKKWAVSIYKNGCHGPQRRREEIIRTVGHEMGHIFWDDHLDEHKRNYWSSQCSSWALSKGYDSREWFCETVGDEVLKPPYLYKFRGLQTSMERRVLEEILRSTREENISV